MKNIEFEKKSFRPLRFNDSKKKMKQIKGKYIVDIDKEYLESVYKEYEAVTKEEKEKVKARIVESIIAFIRNDECTGGIMFFETFIDIKGKRRKSINIHPLLDIDNPKHIHYLKKKNKQ